MSSSESTPATRRAILDRLAEGPVDGPALAASLGITRAAVWNHIDALRAAGFEIESTTTGYAVTAVPEYGGEAVAFGLECDYEIVYEDTTESTNDIARSLAAKGKRDVIVLADAQPNGRGRLGRDWAGPPGGIYLSILFEPTVSPVAVPSMTLAAAVATVEALPSDIEAHIKWPNDVLIPDGKVAGVLTEMKGESDRVHWVIIGIGINANVAPDQLPASAASIADAMGAPVERRSIVQSLIRRFDALRSAPASIIPAWQARAITLGQRVRVRTGSAVIEGTAIDICPPGHLQVETDTGIVTVHAGDCEHLRPVR